MNETTKNLHQVDERKKLMIRWHKGQREKYDETEVIAIEWNPLFSIKY